jgi:hypothetical protein
MYSDPFSRQTKYFIDKNQVASFSFYDTEKFIFKPNYEPGFQRGFEAGVMRQHFCMSSSTPIEAVQKWKQTPGNQPWLHTTEAPWD